MKKEWVRPLTTVQCFEADEYVAACGSEVKTYTFVCDAMRDGLQLTNTSSVYKSNGEYMGNFHPCSATHVVEGTADEFVTGYINSPVLGGLLGNTDVVIWTENGTNLHCTRNLDIDSMVTAKS